MGSAILPSVQAVVIANMSRLILRIFFAPVGCTG